MKRPILILCIDRDNDLFDKAGVSGPLIGRERNLEGAVALSLADPEDPDSNAIFYSVKIYDQMRKDGETVEIVTLTGDKGLGIKADRSVSEQLERVVAELHPASCILVSDGASDEELVPIIKSRIKVDSTKIVVIKQAKELEKTYFVLLEKLRDPYFARILIGIPAILILLFSLSSYLGFGWQPVGIIIGIYLLLRIFGIDDIAMGVAKEFRFSFEKTSWIGHLGAFAILGIGVLVGYQAFQKGLALGFGIEKILALVIGSVIWIMLTAFIMIIAGKSIDALLEKKRYEITRYMLYATAAVLTTIVILVGSRWIVNMSEPYVDFGMFIFTIACSLVFGYFSARTISWYRKEILVSMKLEGKEVISEHGTYLGRIVGVDAKKGKIVIQSAFEKRYVLPISAVNAVEENVIVKAHE